MESKAVFCSVAHTVCQSVRSAVWALWLPSKWLPPEGFTWVSKLGISMTPTSWPHVPFYTIGNQFWGPRSKTSLDGPGPEMLPSGRTKIFMLVICRNSLSRCCTSSNLSDGQTYILGRPFTCRGMILSYWYANSIKYTRNVELGWEGHRTKMSMPFVSFLLFKGLESVWTIWRNSSGKARRSTHRQLCSDDMSWIWFF